MRHLRDALRALLTTMRTAFRRPVTVEFPAEIRPRTARFRTTGFALRHDEHGEERCIGCLQCERICPSRVIAVTQGAKRESQVTGKKRGWADELTIDMSACLYCELCVQVCPTDALVMTHAPTAPVFAREDLVLTMPRLYENERLVPLSWGNGTQLMGMQEDPARDQKAARPAKPDAAPAKPDAAPAAKAATP